MPNQKFDHKKYSSLSNALKKLYTTDKPRNQGRRGNYPEAVQQQFSNLSKRLSKTIAKRNQQVILARAAMFLLAAILGFYLLKITNAATFVTSIESELGNSSGNICKGSDSDASGGGFVTFGETCTGSSTTIAIDGKSSGKLFYGIGAISGGGGNSRYVVNYPSAQQTQMMNLLFKPNYGASLQILKVEIGGDTNSTDGAESSVEHTKANIVCNAGYEWQMMKQAKALNPNIKLYALAWGAPGWISGHTFNSSDTITYLIDWMNCAKNKGYTINYIGDQNERPYDVTWLKNLRTALNNAGYNSTQIVASDKAGGNSPAAAQAAFAVANDMASDSVLKSAVSIVGAHDVCGYPTNGLQCYSSTTAQGLGNPLWMSEAGHMDGNTGAADIARSFNRGYQDARLTGYLQWPLLNAMPPGLSHENYGLITADEPWSGYFTANHQTWAFAHTTQFTAAGWHYVDSGTGFLGGDRTNGSYVTYKSTNNSDWSLVVETSTATAQQTITGNVSGGLNTGTVHVWASNFNSTDLQAGLKN